MASRPDSDPWQEDQDSHRRRAREPQASRLAQRPQRAPARPWWRLVLWALLALSLGLALVVFGLPLLGR